jgi:(2Fe-2S) ferredoxin
MRNHAEEVTNAIREQIASKGEDTRIHTTRTRCMGRCDDGCIVVVYPEGIWYKAVEPHIAQQIVQDHLVDNKIVDKNVLFTYNEHLLPAPNTVVGISKKRGES